MTSDQQSFSIENGILCDGNQRIILAHVCGYRADTHAFIISTSHREITLNARPGEAIKMAEALDKWFHGTPKLNVENLSPLPEFRAALAALRRKSGSDCEAMTEITGTP